MLFANLIVDAFAAMGCMAFALVGAIVAAAAVLARSDAGKAVIDGLKKPKSDPVPSARPEPEGRS